MSVTKAFPHSCDESLHIILLPLGFPQQQGQALNSRTPGSMVLVMRRFFPNQYSVNTCVSMKWPVKGGSWTHQGPLCCEAPIVVRAASLLSWHTYSMLRPGRCWASCTVNKVNSSVLHVCMCALINSL